MSVLIRQTRRAFLALTCFAALPISAAHAQKAPRQTVICIDPGHPSETSEGAAAHGLSENRLNWQVALLLKARLQSMGIASVLTKTRENQLVTNKRRAEIANGANAYKTPCALFLRLHCDEGGGRGFTWYYPDRAGRKGGVVGPPKSVQLESRRASYAINDAMKPFLRGYLQTNAVKTDAATFVGGKQGGVLTGSIYSKVPTALIEMCFINQRSDAQFIASEKGRDRMAYAIAMGIKAYLKR